MKIIHNMGVIVSSHSGNFLALSRGIASILVLIVVARESFNLMLGNKKFDPMWWLRPFLIMAVIGTWTTGLPTAIRKIVSPFEGSAKAQFETRLHELETKKETKLKLLSKKWDELLEKGAEVEAAKEAMEKAKAEEEDSGFSLSPSEWAESFKKSFDSVKQSIINYTKIIALQISTWVDKLIEWLGNFIWSISIYATFMTKELGIAFLVIFGPIHFSLSVYDLWRDAWASWFMRIISFHFYGFVAYLIMTASCSIIDFAIQSDILLLEKKGFPEAFSFNAVYTLAGYLVGAIAIKMVPEVVSWIVPTNASQAAGQFSAGLSASFGTIPVKQGINTAKRLSSKGLGLVTSGVGKINFSGSGGGSSQKPYNSQSTGRGRTAGGGESKSAPSSSQGGSSSSSK